MLFKKSKKIRSLKLRMLLILITDLMANDSNPPKIKSNLDKAYQLVNKVKNEEYTNQFADLALEFYSKYPEFC